MTLNADNFRHHVDYFNSMEPEGVVNRIPNSRSWEWMKGNVPLFACPDTALEQIYYFRWWTFRKHFVQTPAGVVMSEFITPVRHAGMYNTISCALGHHLAEGRWLRDQTYLNEYARFWFHADHGKPEPKFHNYSSWLAWALHERCLVTGDRPSLLEMLDDLVADYGAWEREKRLPDGRFWQFDVRDGMEESISGSRTYRNVRPTINSYMYANARAIAAIAGWVQRADVVAAHTAKAAELKRIVQEQLWDAPAEFFKAQAAEGGLSDAREEIGFIPWCFRLPDAGFEGAWKQLIDSRGFWAPFGITTAERRHPAFRSHGVGDCEWDGAVWPFATSQTLNALANVLRNYHQAIVTRQHYFQAINTYVKCQQFNGKPYIGEYLDEVNGAWLKGDNPRSRYYNHSTFCDLIISGLVGVVPREDSTVEISPLLPDDAWDWFCLDNCCYRGTKLTVIWDRHGEKFGHGSGLMILINDKLVAQSEGLRPLLAENAL